MAEALARTLLDLKNVMENPYRQDGNKHMWFISFGALRYYVTDRLLGKPFTQDLDVSMMYGEVAPDDLIAAFSEFGYECKSTVLDNHAKRPLKMVFGMQKGMMDALCEIDVFFWVKANGYYWHTYDIDNTGATILDEYTFKGTRAEYFERGVWQGTWEETADLLNFPVAFGGMLDVWYPPKTDQDGKPVPNTGWFIEQKHYGQSMADKVVRVRNCKNMYEVLK